MILKQRQIYLSVIYVALTLVGLAEDADAQDIDTIYLPYVQALEREIGYRVLLSRNDDYDPQHKLGAGRSISERLFVEAALISTGSENGIAGYEIETRYQLTEQGQYSADWGLMLEFEYAETMTEFFTGVLVSREWGRWVGTSNIFVGYESGKSIQTEWESMARFQMRYRYQLYLEPALEFHWSEDAQAFGPLISGHLRQSPGNVFYWQAGMMFGLNADTSGTTLKMAIEYEF